MEEEEQRLKYLEFVQAAAVYASLLSAKLYDYAKQNSGPLKPGVLTVEDTVRTVVGPVYDKYHGVPIQFLTFVHRKVLVLSPVFIYLLLLFFYSLQIIGVIFQFNKNNILILVKLDKLCV